MKKVLRIVAGVVLGLSVLAISSTASIGRLNDDPKPPPCTPGVDCLQ